MIKLTVLDKVDCEKSEMIDYRRVPVEADNAGCVCTDIHLKAQLSFSKKLILAAIADL